MRRTDIRVNVDLASLPGSHGFLNGLWMQVHGGCTVGADVAAWPYSVGILCKFTAFLVLCIGLSMLWTWGIFVFLFWSFSYFSSKGLVIDCSVKRLPGHMCGLTVLF